MPLLAQALASGPEARGVRGGSEGWLQLAHEALAAQQSGPDAAALVVAASRARSVKLAELPAEQQQRVCARLAHVVRASTRLPAWDCLRTLHSASFCVCPHEQWLVGAPCGHHLAPAVLQALQVLEEAADTFATPHAIVMMAQAQVAWRCCAPHFWRRALWPATRQWAYDGVTAASLAVAYARLVEMQLAPFDAQLWGCLREALAAWLPSLTPVLLAGVLLA